MAPPSNEINQWRQDRWWLDDEYVSQYEHAISPDQVDCCVAAILRVFDEKWIQQDLPHKAYYEIFSRGSMPLNAIIGLGSDLIAVQNSAGFRKIMNGLRDPWNYDSAKLELAVAAMYRDAGYEIELHPKTRTPKEADLLTRLDGEEVFFEIKTLAESDETKNIRSFTTWLMSALGELIPPERDSPARQLNWRVELAPDIWNRSLKQVAQGEHVADFLSELNATISLHIDKGPGTFEIPGIGLFELAPASSLPECGVRTIINPANELSRIMRSRFRNALQQLPPNKPGVVVFRTEGILQESVSNTAVQSLFKAEAQNAAHVSAVIFLPVSYAVPQRWSPFKKFAVQNPCAQFPASNLRAFRTFVDLCGLVVFEPN